MRFARVTVLLLFAALFAVEPVVHSHPLLAGHGAPNDEITTANLCAICAVGTHSIVVDASPVFAPTVVVELLTAVPLLPHSTDTRIALAARAPPAA